MHHFMRHGKYMKYRAIKSIEEDIDWLGLDNEVE